MYSACGHVQAKAKERVIETLTSELEQAEREAELAHVENKDLAKQLQMMKAELDKYVVRFRTMERVSSLISHRFRGLRTLHNIVARSYRS